MSTLYGMLEHDVSDDEYVEKVGQEIVWEAVQRYTGRLTMAMDQALQVFLERTTTDYKWLHKLPGGGYMQRMNLRAQGQPHAIKAAGEYEVGLPLDRFEDAFLDNEYDAAHLTMGEVQRRMDTLRSRYSATVRRELGYAFFRNVNRTFDDPQKGTITVRPLANGDGTIYPPTYYAADGADDTHYLPSGYVSGDISDANNPLVTIRDELREHVGYSETGENIVVFVHRDDAPNVTDSLSNFIPITDSQIRPGDDEATVTGRPAGVPGLLLGRSDGVWVVDWSWGVPAGYMLGFHLDMPKPLARRIPLVRSLGDGGLEVVARESMHPFETAKWRTMFGLGVVNRLSAVVLQLTAGSYAIPTAFASSPGTA
jgi:hypothetical protein